MTRWRGAVRAATFVTCLVLVGGCGGVEQREGARDVAVQLATPTEFAGLLSRGYIVDMVPLKSVEDLIDSATVVIRGNISRVMPGRVIRTSDGLLVRKTLLIVVDVAEVYQGELEGDDSLAYVEVEATVADPAEIVDAVAQSRRTLSFTSTLWGLRQPKKPVVTGRKGGQLIELSIS